jgi:hypothetical protein
MPSSFGEDGLLCRRRRFNRLRDTTLQKMPEIGALDRTNSFRTKKSVLQLRTVLGSRVCRDKVANPCLVR